MTTERLQMICDYVFGAILNVGILYLGRGIGIHDVQEKSSFGLSPLISILGTVDVLWAQGMWSSRRRSQAVELEKKP